MTSINRVEIIDRDGWRKEYPLQRSICLIGSAPGSDIVLDRKHGGGVEARHLQLIHMPNQGYRLVNLSDKSVTLDEAGEQTLASRAAIDIGGGQRLKLGDFTIIFHAGGRSSAAMSGGAALSMPSGPALSAAEGMAVGEQSSDYIGLELVLSQTTLAPGQSIDGAVTVRNQGDKPGVQFKVEVEGLEEDCYNIGSGPVLFPNAEKALSLRLHHPRKPSPVAGTRQLKIHAIAPEAYPRERATAAVTIQVLPFYQHKLSLERVE